MYIPADGAKRPNILLRVDEPHLRQLGQLRRVQLLRRNCIVRNTTFNQSDPAHSRLNYVNHKRQRPLRSTIRPDTTDTMRHRYTSLRRLQLLSEHTARRFGRRTVGVGRTRTAKPSEHVQQSVHVHPRSSTQTASRSAHVSAQRRDPRL